MNAPVQVREVDLATEVSSGDLIALTPQTTLAILTDEKQFDSLLARVRAEVAAHVPDLTTDKGRKAIASLAFKVTKTKTALDDAGKKLTEDKRAEIKAVDDSRRKIREALDGLRDEARKPLTDWETAEETRVAECNALMKAMTDAAVVTVDDTSETVSARLDEVRGRNLDPTLFGSEIDLAQQRRDHAVATLGAALERLRQEEADRAELGRLRAEKEEREQLDRRALAQAQYADAIAEHIRQVGLGSIDGQSYTYPILIRELEDKVVIDDSFGDRREGLEALRVETLNLVKAAFEAHLARAAKEEASRRELEILTAKQEAADRARIEAECKAEEDRRAQEQAHADALAAEKRRADEAEAARKADAEAAAKAAVAEKAAAETQAKAQAAREADIAHRSSVLRAAKEALMEHCTMKEAAAKAVIQAIASRLVPNVTISF